MVRHSNVPCAINPWLILTNQNYAQMAQSSMPTYEVVNFIQIFGYIMLRILHISTARVCEAFHPFLLCRNYKFGSVKSHEEWKSFIY